MIQRIFLAFYRLFEAPEFVLLLHLIFAFGVIFFIYCRGDAMGKARVIDPFSSSWTLTAWCATDVLS